jgi:GNAT superfamily N-acetyltransferase
MGYIIRKAEEKDVTDILKLLSQLICLNSNEQFLLEQIKLLNFNSDYYIAVADMNGHIVGIAMGILCQNICKPLSPFMVVENVIVAPSYRKQGIGRNIMLHLEKWAIKNKCGYISLVSQSKRTEAHRFYESLGYKHDDGFQKFLYNPTNL